MSDEITPEKLGVLKADETQVTIACPDFPKYIWLHYPGGGCSLCLECTEFFDDKFHGRYYRDAGAWGIYAKYDGDNLAAVSKIHETARLDGNKITAITKKQYEEDNEGYL